MTTLKASSHAAGLLLLMTMVLRPAPPVLAANGIAVVTAFDGVVYVQSGVDLVAVSRVGQRLYDGDRLQTLAGSVWLRFDNAASLNLQPFSSAWLQEREENRPWWFHFNTRAVRRITCLVGKLRFKSAARGRKNFLQTPTAVIGLRGSEGEIGFDNVRTFLNLISGQTDTVGKVTRAPFANPGPAAAPANPGFRSLEAARQTYDRARASQDEGQLRRARIMVARSMHMVGQALETNPDPVVSDDGVRQKAAAREMIDTLSRAETNSAPNVRVVEESSVSVPAPSNTAPTVTDQTPASPTGNVDATTPATAEKETAPDTAGNADNPKDHNAGSGKNTPGTAADNSNSSSVDGANTP